LRWVFWSKELTSFLPCLLFSFLEIGWLYQMEFCLILCFRLHSNPN
jgi:hypothetical protein